jgi:hypothetical protein
VEQGNGVGATGATGVGAVGVGVAAKQYWNSPSVHTYVKPKSAHVLVVVLVVV